MPPQQNLVLAVARHLSRAMPFLSNLLLTQPPQLTALFGKLVSICNLLKHSYAAEYNLSIIVALAGEKTAFSVGVSPTLGNRSDKTANGGLNDDNTIPVLFGLRIQFGIMIWSGDIPA